MKAGVCGIYCISSQATGECYVGSSQDIAVRLAKHRYQLRCGVHHCPPLQECFDLYGLDDLTFSVLEECPRDRLVEREQYWIQTTGAKLNVLSTIWPAVQHSEEQRAKWRRERKGQHLKFTDEDLQRLLDEGLNATQISERLGVARQNVNRRRRELGLASAAKGGRPLGSKDKDQRTRENYWRKIDDTFLIESWDEGFSAATIAESVGMSPVNIAARLRRLSAEGKVVYPRSKEIEQILRDCLERGMTAADIAAECDVPLNTVQRRLQKYRLQKDLP